MINYIKKILNRQWSRTIFRYLLYQIFFRPEAIPSIITVVDYMTSLNYGRTGGQTIVLQSMTTVHTFLWRERALGRFHPLGDTGSDCDRGDQQLVHDD